MQSPSTSTPSGIDSHFNCGAFNVPTRSSSICSLTLDQAYVTTHFRFLTQVCNAAFPRSLFVLTTLSVVDCLHKFDKDCLIQAWKVNASCPLCMKLSTRAMYDFNLVSLMDAVLPNRSKPDNDQITHEDITPFQPQGPPVGGGWGLLASNLGSEHYSDEEMDEDEDMDMRGDSPGGGLAWPCPSCIPGNVTGYTCHVPIPTPTMASIEAESRELGRPIRAPLPHETRVPIEGLVV